jgi:hypothetical protein
MVKNPREAPWRRQAIGSLNRRNNKAPWSIRGIPIFILHLRVLESAAMIAATMKYTKRCRLMLTDDIAS